MGVRQRPGGPPSAFTPGQCVRRSRFEGLRFRRLGETSFFQAEACGDAKAGAKAVNSVGICIEDVCFSYGSQPVLDSVTLRVPKGEIWALVGRSGTGKTTLLNAVAGLFAPTRGRISVAGRDTMNAGRIRGIVFQEDSLLGWLSALDNVLFPFDRDANHAFRTEAESLLKAVGLADCAAALPQELSSGMRRRLEFA